MLDLFEFLTHTIFESINLKNTKNDTIRSHKKQDLMQKL